MSEFIYLDYNATTPVDPAVLEAMLPALKGDYGNPSSSHALGQKAREAVENARRELAGLVNADPSEILFTSGGSESNNCVIMGLAEEAPLRKRHIITSAIEHPAVVEPLKLLEARGWRVTWLPVDGTGLVNPFELEKVIDDETALVSVMLANNETGALQPVQELAKVCRKHGVLFHSDAAQAVGKIPVDVKQLGVDFLSVAGHKIYAPKGVGALYIRGGRKLPPFIRGAGQESGRRAGTENVPYIVGLGAAAKLAGRRMHLDMDHSRELRDRLLVGLVRKFPGEKMRINGPLTKTPELCLPGTLSVSFKGLKASDLLAELRDRLAASAGAACNKEGTKISAVLEAMGVPGEWAVGTLRLSVGRMSRELEVDRAVEILAKTIETLKSKA